MSLPHVHAASRPALGPRHVATFLTRPLDAMRRAAALARQRRQLAQLSADRLTDLGLNPEEARREAARPFWDAPRHWRS